MEARSESCHTSTLICMSVVRLSLRADVFTQAITRMFATKIKSPLNIYKIERFVHKKVHTKPKKFEIMWTKSSMVIIQMKATKKYSSVGLFIVLNKVVLTFESACA